MQASRTAVAAAAALGAAAAGWATDASAQNGALRDLFSKSGPGARAPQYPPVGRYVAAQGQTFVLDRSGGTVLLKFDGSNEVWALQPAPGPRGDMIYRDDVGRPMVRATRLGGLTVFTADRPTGTPAAFTAASAPLKPRTLSPGALLQQLAQASTRASRAARRLLTFEAPDVDVGEETLFADAANVAADGVVAAAATPGGRVRLSRLRIVRLTEGERPTVSVQGATLEVVVAPARGLAGRPSSRRAAQAIAEAR